MFRNKFYIAVLISLLISVLSISCRDRTGVGKPFSIALDGNFSVLDPIGSATVTANDERLRTLLFNSLVKKNDQFDYVGELAKEIKTSEDGTIITFVLLDGVKFHDGKTLTSADVKYTLDKLFATNGAKASAFYDTVGNEKKPHIISVETPDEKTVNVKIARPALKNQLLSNLVPVAIIPNGSEVGTEASKIKPPPGTGPYKFINFDSVQSIVEVVRFNEYFEGAPAIEKFKSRVYPTQTRCRLNSNRRSSIWLRA